MRVYLIEGLLLVVLSLIGLTEGLSICKRVAFQREPLTAGWYLVGVSAVLLVCSVAHLVVEWRRARTAPDIKELRSGLGMGVWGIMVGYAFLVPLFGYPLATLLFFTAVFYLLNIRPWVKAGLVGLMFTVGFYLAFVWLANVLLPSGWVGQVLDLLW